MAGEHDLASPDDIGRPTLDPDSGLNTEFTLDDILWVLQRLETGRHLQSGDTSLVLIGGQALNYWCDRYRVDNPELDQHGPFASKDIDFQASRTLIPWCSEQVGGNYALAVSGDKSSLLNGVVTIPIAHGKALRLDFMQRAYGLGAAEVVKSAATVHVNAESPFDLKVMHPLHCMKSRVKNVIGLPKQYANDHGIRQLRASIVCVRLFIEETADDDERRGLALNAKVFEFALHDLDAENLYRTRQIDVFDAVSNAECFPEKFRTTRYPQMLQELTKRR